MNSEMQVETITLPAALTSRLTAEQRAILNETDIKKVVASLTASTDKILLAIEDTLVAYIRLLQLGYPREELNRLVNNRYIEKMAFGQVIPELVVALMGRQNLLKRAAMLPLPDQQMFANNTPIKVMEADGDHRLVPALDLSSKQIEQVFGENCLRSESEQIQFLSDQRKQVEQVVIEEEPVKIQKNAVVIVRPVRLSFMRVKALYEELRRQRSSSKE